MNKEVQDKLVAEAVEKQLAVLGLTEMVKKLKFNTSDEGKTPEAKKAEKVLKFFQAQINNDLATVKALSGGVSDSGLTLLPIEFQNDVIDRVVHDMYALRNYCTQVPVTYRSGFFPVGSSGVVMSWDGEGSPITETTPTFDQLPYGVNRLDGYTAISRELLADTPIKLYDYLTMQYSKAIVKEENRVILGGSGTSQPLGIRTDTGIKLLPAVNGATGGTGLLVVDDILTLPLTLDPNYRAGGGYYVSTKGMKEIRTLKDGFGRPMFQAGDMTNGIPDKINGYPVFEFATAIPDNLTYNGIANTTEIVFGNLENYYFFDKGEMGSEVNTASDQAFKNHQALIKVWERIDGKCAIPAAFVKLQGIKVA
jgi:HK97 family phage major capsid protein